MSAFSETLMDHCQSPRNRGVMGTSDLVGTAGVPGQGRFVRLFLKIAGGRVARMQFDCYGCGVTVAVCSVLTELTEGLSKPACAAISSGQIAEALDGIPPHKMDCPPFALAALREALDQWPEDANANDSQTLLSKLH